MNNSNSHFSKLPSVSIQRSIMDRNSSHKTTFNAGKLIPVYVDEVLPGDTVTMDVSSLCRMSTPVFPVMDDAYLDFHFFFVPSRILWDNWERFNGASDDEWAQEVEYKIPTITVPSPTVGGIFDHFGLPVGKSITVNSLPFRAYYMIWNEWFRDQNVMDSYLINKGNSNSLLDFNGFELAPVSKYHDYFTSALPSPQKGAAVSLPLGGMAPVYTSSEQTVSDGVVVPIYFRGTDNIPTSTVIGLNREGYVSATAKSFVGTPDSQITPESVSVEPSNLWADMTQVTGATINALRQAFAVQRLLEKDARGGTRYRELVKAHFGVLTGDARVQVPEYLGGRHIPIQVNQVVQMSATDDVSPQGNTAAFSKTTDYGSLFTKSFTEHGYLIGLASVRTTHTYQQGINKLWSRQGRFDFYWPELAFIGEQPILNKEIYAQGTIQDDEVFGYQEAWAEYRYKPSTVSGSFRSGVNGTLDAWHYGDYYDSMPALSKGWLVETDANIDRTLAVSSELSDQFLLDCYFKARWARPMPVYSIPDMRGYF